MLKNLTIVALTVLLSVSAQAQTKKKRATKKATPAAEATLPETAPAAAEPTPAPVTEAAPVAEPAPAAPPASAGKISQMNWQPADGQSGLELRLTYAMATYDITPTATGGKFDATMMKLGLAYDYGFTAMNSVGISTDLMNNTTVKVTPTGGTGGDVKMSGMGDIFINSKNYSGMGGMNLLYGLSLGFSPGKKKPPQSTILGDPSNADGNNYSGGLSVPVYVGVEGGTGGGFWGVKLTYGLMMERSQDNGSGAAESKITGGNTLGLRAYYEGGGDPSYWNVYAGFASAGETETKTGTAAATKAAAMSAIEFGASWGTYLTPGMLLALHYDGASIAERDYGAVNSGQKEAAHLQHGLGVRGRWEF